MTLEEHKENETGVKSEGASSPDIAEILSRKLELNEKLLVDMSNTLMAILKERENKEDDKIPSLKSMELNFRKILNALENRLNSLENDMSIFQGNIMSLEQNKLNVAASIEDLRRAMQKQPKNEISGLIQKMDSLEAEIKSVGSGDAMNEIINRISGLENKIESVRASTVFDEQLTEIVSRLVFLESRVAGMESMIQDIPRYSPIVVE